MAAGAIRRPPKNNSANMIKNATTCITELRRYRRNNAIRFPTVTANRLFSSPPQLTDSNVSRDSGRQPVSVVICPLSAVVREEYTFPHGFRISTHEEAGYKRDVSDVARSLPTAGGSMTLDIDGLGKQYGDTWALRDVSFDVSSGVVGLLGPNGAGKSTLMRIVTTVTTPTEGTVRWNGTDVTENPTPMRRAVGYLPQSFGTYPNLTAREFLHYLAGVRGVTDPGDRIDELLSVVNLTDDADRALGGFSGGMRRRVGIAQALVADPDLLIVDEPTVGLDPTERARFRNLLTELAADRVVILSTHIVSDIEATASEIALLEDGSLLTHTDPGTLLDRVDGAVWEVVVPESELAATKRAHTVSGTTRRPDGVHLRVVSETRPEGDARPVDPTLEDAYLDIVDRQTPTVSDEASSVSPEVSGE
jgi:ABC-2 type transport system ATP-binding protein